MYLAYVDESGDPGETGSQTFVVACVLVHEARWLGALDGLVGYRRWMRDQFGIPLRAELKANYLIRNGGPHLSAHPLSESARRAIYRQTLRLQAKLSTQVFAILIDKPKLAARGGQPLATAWEQLLNRLERFCAYNDTRVMVVHDQTDQLIVRGKARRARRFGYVGAHFGPGTLARPFHQLLDDPIPRDSRDSYLLQVADLCAYAAFRRVIPPPARSASIVPQKTWDELGGAKLLDVNKLIARTTPVPDAIVVWPR
jgi:hypothetical protein